MNFKCVDCDQKDIHIEARVDVLDSNGSKIGQGIVEQYSTPINGVSESVFIKATDGKEVGTTSWPTKQLRVR